VTGKSWLDGKVGGIRIGRSERVRVRPMVMGGIASLIEAEAEAREVLVSVAVGWLLPPSANA
jgi:hypothetical protein